MVEFILLLISQISLHLDNKCTLDGYFVNYYNEIHICNLLPLEEKKYILGHELGHYFYSIQNIETKNKWYQLYNSGSKITPSLYNLIPSDYISEYAITSDKEDFAEVFAYVIYPKNQRFIINKSEILERKIDFIKGLIK